MDINNIVNNKVENVTQPRMAPVKGQNEPAAADTIKNSTSNTVDSENGKKLSKDNINNMVDALNSAAKSVNQNQRVQFSFDDKTDRVIIKFINSATNEVIKEIPPKEMIRLLERMHEMIGMFVDESR